MAAIDDEDYIRAMQHSWCLDQHEYAVSRINNKKVYLHRFITNAPKGTWVDHINHDRLDNRSSNLRLCTKAENNRHSRKGKNNTSGYKGVTWSKKVGKWQAQICFNYKNIILGYFEDKKEAAKTYNEAVFKYFGEYAVLNQV